MSNTDKLREEAEAEGIDIDSYPYTLEDGEFFEVEDFGNPNPEQYYKYNQNGHNQQETTK